MSVTAPSRSSFRGSTRDRRFPRFSSSCGSVTWGQENAGPVEHPVYFVNVFKNIYLQWNRIQEWPFIVILYVWQMGRLWVELFDILTYCLVRLCRHNKYWTANLPLKSSNKCISFFFKQQAHIFNAAFKYFIKKFQQLSLELHFCLCYKRKTVTHNLQYCFWFNSSINNS